VTAGATSETKTVTIPVAYAQAGYTCDNAHRFSATDYASEAPDSLAVFTVTAVSVTLTPNIGPPDTVVHVTGSGFTPGRRYQIYFDPSGVNVLVVDFVALSDGSMPLSTFTVPDDTAGAKDVVVKEYGGTLII